jgi:hypothetical protein
MSDDAALGECMECGAPADPVAIQTLSCYACGSDEIRVFSEEGIVVVNIDADALIDAIKRFGEALAEALNNLNKWIVEHERQAGR